MSGELCSICGERLFSFGEPSGPTTGNNGAAPDAAICGLCRRARPHFELAVAFGSYDGTLRELLHLLKYEGVRPVAGLLGELMAQSIDAAALADRDLMVVPVPLHGSRRSQRGFNQAELLAKTAVRNLGRDWKVQTECLRRVRPTTSQTGLTRHQRRANVRGAFRVQRSSEVTGRQILLIDDVLTTGTTAAECARVLKRAGARQVFVATVARVLKAENFHVLTGGETGLRVERTDERPSSF